MLRGMFEERLQYIIREAREWPDLICSLMRRTPSSDAAQTFKSVLAQGEILVIRGHDIERIQEHVQETKCSHGAFAAYLSQNQPLRRFGRF